MAVLTKRVKTWSDALRYSGQFMESGVAAALAALWGFLSTHELISIWVKCKRDARKVNSDAVQVSSKMWFSILLTVYQYVQ